MAGRGGRRARQLGTDPEATSVRVDAECDLWRRAPVSVVVGLDLAEAWRRARADWPNLEGSHDPGDEACVVEVDGRAVMLLALGFEVSVFVHEAVHIAASILRSRGVPFTDPNEETVAHMVEWVVRETLAPAQTWTPEPRSAPEPAPVLQPEPQTASNPSPDAGRGTVS